MHGKIRSRQSQFTGGQTGHLAKIFSMISIVSSIISKVPAEVPGAA